ncbi:Glu/Leu/Phe/Val dehydrogenase dimerization domain-containing protein [Nocardia sp. NPDC051570]|uniref:Glu/Leu/Phe/Val dehydrogenase dimerization domain-containing protein n=1 Tax=Nocardia sp. NPDC051570 TaxID=3364324 RepID=UPI00379FCA65
MAPPLSTTTLHDSATGLTAYVVTDSLIDGKAMGGLRMTPDVSPQILAMLSRQMTLKLALHGLPIGGAKGGIVSGLPRGSRRDEVLAAFGRAVRPLLHGGIYLGSDQGINYRDRHIIFSTADYDVKLPGGACSWAELWDQCSLITGFGVAEAIATTTDSEPGERRRIAIHGFGSVGRGAAVHLSERGHLIVAIADRLGTMSRPQGLPLAEITALTDATGVVDRTRLPADVRCVDDPAAVIAAEADVLVLAAVAGAVTDANVDHIRAGLVVEGANGPCTESALTALAARKVDVIPGIVANAGGAIATGLVLTEWLPRHALSSEAQPGPEHRTRAAKVFAEILHAEVARRIRSAGREVAERTTTGITPHEAAERLAQENATPNHPSLLND